MTYEILDRNDDSEGTFTSGHHAIGRAENRVLELAQHSGNPEVLYVVENGVLMAVIRSQLSTTIEYPAKF